MDRQHALKPAWPAPGNKHSDGASPEARCSAMEATVVCGRMKVKHVSSTLYLHQGVHGLFPSLESHLHRTRWFIILGTIPSVKNHTWLLVSPR